MKRFILLSALPGAGKSTWARKYQSTHPNTFIVSSDLIRLEYFGAIDNFEHEKEVWDLFLKIIKYYAKNDDVTVIADSTNINNEYRAYYANETRPCFDRLSLVYFDIPLEMSLKQNAQRIGAAVVPTDAVMDMARRFEAPNEETLALFDDFLTVKPGFDTADI